MGTAKQQRVPQWTYRVEYDSRGDDSDLCWRWIVNHGGTPVGAGWATTRDDGVGAATEFGNEERAKTNDGEYDPVEGAL